MGLQMGPVGSAVPLAGTVARSHGSPTAQAAGPAPFRASLTSKRLTSTSAISVHVRSHFTQPQSSSCSIPSQPSEV